MKKKNSSLITVLSNIISIATSIIVSFFVSKYIVEAVGKEAYSFYPIANNLSTYFSLVFLILNSTSTRLIMIPFLKKELVESEEYYSTVFLSCLFLSFFIGVIELAFYFNLSNVLNIPSNLLLDVKKLFILIFINSIISGTTSVFTTVYYVKNRMDLYAISKIIESLTKGVVLIIMIWSNSLTIVLFGLVNLLSNCSRIAFNIYSSSKFLNEIKIKINSFSFNKLKNVLSLGIWTIISSSGSLLISNIQLIFSNVYLGVTDSSMLSLVQPLVTMCSLINTTARTVMEPNMIKMVVEDDNELVNKCNLAMMASIFVPSMLLICLGGSFYKVYLPNEDSKSLFLLSGLSCFQTFLASSTTLQISALGTFFKEKEKSLMLLLAGVLNMVLLFVLLKNTHLGNYAILFPGIIAYFIYYVMYIPTKSQSVLSKMNKKIKINNYKNIIYTIVIIIVNLSIANITIIENNICNFIVQSFIALCLDYFILFAFYHVNFKMFITDLLKNERK